MASGHLNTQGPHRRHWVGTENNPEEDSLLSRLAREEEPTLPKGVNYIGFQLEEGEEGTPHYQIYIELGRSQYLSWLKKNISKTAHWEARQGTAKEANAYCTEEEYKGKAKGRLDGPWIIGKMSMGNGERTDLVDFRDAIILGKRKRELWMTHTKQMARYRHMYSDIKQLYMPKRNKELLVCLLVGPTGTGKTRKVHDAWSELDEQYWSMPISSGKMWFDGYDGHERVLLDDFAGRMSKTPLLFLLWILDRYPRYLEIKGSGVWYMPNYISITSNYHPRQWYDWKDREPSYAALCRRIDYVLEFDQNGSTQCEDLQAYFAQRFATTYCKHDKCKFYEECQIKD